MIFYDFNIFWSFVIFLKIFRLSKNCLIIHTRPLCTVRRVSHCTNFARVFGDPACQMLVPKPVFNFIDLNFDLSSFSLSLETLNANSEHFAGIRTDQFWIGLHGSYIFIYPHDK